MIRIALLSSLAATLAAGAPVVAAPQPPYAGVFALQGATPRVAMHLALAPGRTAQDARLDVWATAPGSTAPLVAYRTVHTKTIHLVVVGDDLGTFMHVHPDLNGGHFVESLHVPHPGLYHIFADVTLARIGQQVFRFDVPFGSSSRTPVMQTVPRRATVAGPYVVALSTLALTAGTTTPVTVSIDRGGKPAQDLAPYLGAAAHAVFIHWADWTYLHVHPSIGGANGMAGMAAMNTSAAMDEAPLLAGPVPPTFVLNVNAVEPGAYKCWLEFKGAGVVRDAPFVLRAR